MFYFKPNGQYAVVCAGNDDLHRLETEGLKTLAKLAKSGDKYAQACIQRLVNSKVIPEGNY